MNLEEAKKIIKDFIKYCRFNQKRKYNDKQLFKAMEYFAFNNFIPKKKIEDKIEELKNIESKTCKKIFNSQRTYWTEVIEDILQELLEGTNENTQEN